MAHDGPEPVGVPGDPVGHVTAVGAAHHRRPGSVDVRPGHGSVGGRHHVGERAAAPLVVGAGDEVLPVAGGQGRVGQQHRVPARGQQPRVPAPGPGIPAGHRATVHPQHERRGRLHRRGPGQHQPAPDARAVVGGGLDLRQPPRQRQRASRAGQPFRLLARGGFEPDGRWRLVHRGAQRKDVAAVRGRAQIGVGTVVGADPRHLTGRVIGPGLHPEYRAAALIVGREVERFGVRCPGQLDGPPVEPGQ